MRTYFGLAAVGVSTTTLLGVVGWTMAPEKAGWWILVIAFPLLLWAFLESAAANGSTEAARAIMRVHRLVIAALALVITLDAGTDLAIGAGILGHDGDLVARRFGGLMKGALFALWGNHLPKLMSPWALVREPFDWQGVHRFVGRVAVAAGVALMLAWSTLPVDEAAGTATLIGASACVLALGCKAISVLRYSGQERRSRQP